MEQQQHPSQQAQTPQPGVQQQFTAPSAAKQSQQQPQTTQQQPPADEQASLAQGSFQHPAQVQAAQPFQPQPSQQPQNDQMLQSYQGASTGPPPSSQDQQPGAFAVNAQPDECQDPAAVNYAQQQQLPGAATTAGLAPEIIQQLLEQIQQQASGQMVAPQPHKQFPAPSDQQQQANIQAQQPSAQILEIQQQLQYAQQPMASAAAPPQQQTQGYDQFSRQIPIPIPQSAAAQQNQGALAPAQLEQMLGSLPQLFSGQQQQQPNQHAQQQPSAQVPGQQQQAGNPPISQIVGLLAELQQNLTTISQMQRRTQPVPPPQVQNQLSGQQQAQPGVQGEYPPQQQLKQQQAPAQQVRQQNQSVPQASAQPPFVDPKNAGQGQGHFIKFFVGGILYSAKEFDVEKYFQQFGQVVDVAIMRDKKTGRSRGFAFVTFRQASAEQVEMLKQTLLSPPPGHPHVIQGRAIEVREGDGNKPADSFLGKTAGTSQPEQLPRPITSGHHNTLPTPPHSQQQNNNSTSNRRRDNSREKGQGGRLRSRSRDRSQQRSSNQRQQSGNGQGNQNGQGGSFQDHQRRREKETERLERPGGTKDKVFVGGLDYQLTDEQFVGHFEEFGKVKEAQIVRDPVTNASRGFGFVTFINENVARRLITELQKCEINGRMVDLRTAEPKLSEKIAIINKSFHEKSHSSGMGGQNGGLAGNGNGNHQQNFNQGGNQKSGGNSNRDNNQFDENKNRRGSNNNNVRNNNSSGGGGGGGRDRNNSRFGGNGLAGGDQRGRSRNPNNNQSSGGQQQPEQQSSMLDFAHDRPFSHFLGHQYQQQPQQQSDQDFARQTGSGGQGRKQSDQGKRGQHPLIQEATNSGQGGQNSGDRRAGGGAGYSRPPPTQTSALGKSNDQPSGGSVLDMDKPLFASGFAADNLFGKYSTNSCSASRSGQQRGGSSGGNQNHQGQDSQIRADMSLASMKTSNERGNGGQSSQKQGNSKS